MLVFPTHVGASGEVLASVGVDCDAMNLAGRLGAYAAFPFPAEGGSVSFVFDKITLSSHELFAILPASSSRERGN